METVAVTHLISNLFWRMPFFSFLKDLLNRLSVLAAMQLAPHLPATRTTWSAPHFRLSTVGLCRCLSLLCPVYMSTCCLTFTLSLCPVYMLSDAHCPVYLRLPVGWCEFIWISTSAVTSSSGVPRTRRFSLLTCVPQVMLT